MQNPPFEVNKELEGWLLFWARLEVVPGGEEDLAALREDAVQSVRAHWTVEKIAEHPVISALRGLFKAAGCDPSRYRPSSEALLRRILKGDELPALHPLIDINNCLSIELAVPCCVMTEGTFSPPLVLRAGLEGENYESLRGPFQAAGKPLLADAIGPLDTPITGNERVKITKQTEVAWLVAYLPENVVTAELARDTLVQMLKSAPVARSSWLSVS